MERSWLDALPLHSIFNESSNRNRIASSSRHHHHQGEQQLPPSPGLSTVASFNGGDEEEDESTRIFQQQDSNGVNTSTYKQFKHNATSVIRKTELLVAVGSQIRLGDLAHFKTRVEAGGYHDEGASSSIFNGDTTTNADHSAAAAAAAGPSSHSIGSYKTLSTPAIDFEILSLVPSPSSRYVAAVGASQVVVIQIPRRGWNSLVGRSIECSQDPVGPFYHTRSSETIAQVSFHPWGVDDSTLLVLTSDGILREYDVLDEPEEPTQIIDFSQADGQSMPPVDATPSKGVRYGLRTNTPRRDRASASATPGASSSSRRRSRSRSRSRTRSISRATPSKYSQQQHKHGKGGMYGLTDDETIKAVSFCIGKGESDWSPFTLFCLMQNGDLFCVCPYLPKTAQISSYLLDSLSALTSAKLNHLSSTGQELQLSLYEKREIEAEYTSQIKFLNALLEQRSGSRSSEDEEQSADFTDATILVKYPPYLRRPPTRQGPFLLQPAPCELDTDEDEPLACDVLYVTPESNNDDTESTAEGNEPSFVLIAYNNGKVDVCMDIVKVEATWSRQDADSVLPTLLVYESVDLFGAAGAQYRNGPVQLINDPEYADVLYAQHNLGVHSISLQPLFDLFSQASSGTDDSLAPILQSPKQASVSWLVQESLDRSDQSFLQDSAIGVTVINDVYLGYAVVVLHANMHVTAIELALRSERMLDLDSDIDQPLVPSKEDARELKESEHPAYIAFAGAPDFNLPELLTKNGSSRRLSTRYASPPPSSSRGTRASKDAQPKMELTVESLRFVGGTIEALDKSIRELISAANAVQERLGVQLEEIPRQVDKLIGIDDDLNQRKSDLSNSFANRIEDVKRRQQSIASRADHILQKLIDASQPDLSVYEKRWIEELERVQHTVGSLEERKSLESRAERLREQLDVLRPRLEQMARAKDGLVFGKSSQERLGDAQRKRVEAALAEESRLVGEARSRIERIQKKIAVSSRTSVNVGR